MFGFGVSMLSSYGLVLLLVPEKAFVPEVTPMFMASLVLVLLICTALTAVVYHQRAEVFAARQQLLRAQARLSLAEGAAAQARLAAALSHELNSPIGAARSSLETLSLVLQKYKAGELAVEQMVNLLDEMREPAGRSTERLVAIVERMQRVTNLDRAEAATVDVNALLQDTVAVLPEVSRRARVTLRLQRLTPLHCRPQQLSALFSNLLRNAGEAVGENGAIEIRSAMSAASIVVEIEDNGRGIPKEKLDVLFEPRFVVSEGRVSTTNWGLFNCRSIVTSLGGEIEVQSAPGTGTLVRVEIPATRLESE
jgi:signal transduction histidine kinase